MCEAERLSHLGKAESIVGVVIPLSELMSLTFGGAKDHSDKLMKLHSLRQTNVCWLCQHLQIFYELSRASHHPILLSQYENYTEKLNS